jgi:hypothetical protein
VIRARPFTAADADAWDALVADAPAATFMLTRRFLSYHADRFDDRSLVLHDERERLVAVLPAAADPGEPAVAVSHPGLTYGGLVCAPDVAGQAVLDALAAVAGELARLGHTTLRYKALPTIYHRRPAQDDRYALHRLGARLVRVDLTNAVTLEDPARRGSQRRRGLQRARKAGVEVVEGPELLGEYWPLLEAVLGARHGARPAHTLAEIERLHALFGDAVRFTGARLDGALVAGIVVFDMGVVQHAQYIASGPEGNGVNALDLVFDHAIARATTDGAKFFNFGISTEQGGAVLNSGLYDFKAGFGATGVVHEFYDLNL